MTRTQYTIGNWKMNLSIAESKTLATELCKKYEPKNGKVLGICAQAIQFPLLVEQFNAAHIFNGVQNVYCDSSGAFTGENSADLIKELGGKYVIIGHSERRSIFKEEDALLAKKVSYVLSLGLTPIFCVGESLKEREAGKQEYIVEQQLIEGLFHLSEEEIKQVIIAYEPVWAIGTGKTASADQAQEMHASIRQKLNFNYTNESSQEISILYGGSVKPSNATEIFSKEDVDGGLIGGASLKSADLLAIYSAM